jgi:CheY-like chemotaxis protein
MRNRPKKVLLAEDNRVLLAASKFALERAGYEVILATDGEQALRLAPHTLPDLIILDMLLPKLPGNEVLRLLKKDPLTAGIPVVVVSALSQLNEPKLVEDGAAAYYEKANLGPEMLSDIVRAIIGAPPATGREGPYRPESAEVQERIV